MRINEIMTRQPQFLQMDQPVHEAAALMRDENLGFLPICDAERQVLGTLTDRDIAMRIVAAKRTSDTLVRDIMTAEVISCEQTAEVHEAEKLMREHQVSRLCCLDAQGKLAGVVGLADLAQRDDPEHAARVLRDVKGGHAIEGLAPH